MVFGGQYFDSITINYLWVVVSKKEITAIFILFTQFTIIISFYCIILYIFA